MPGAASHISESTEAALKQAVQRLLAPIARLCLSHGLRVAVPQELLKRAYVDAARAAQPPGVGQRDISRVSTTTGLTRREVMRISNDVTAPAVRRPSPAIQAFTRWMSSRRYLDKDGQPRLLKRQGRAPSFDALARSVTLDVHPRRLLDELCRLGLAHHDEATDTVSLLRDTFAPREDQERMFGFLGSNVGDHMAAAVANVLADKPPHLEQAIFADELSVESMDKLRKVVNAQWKAMVAAVVPEIEALLEADRKAAGEAQQRVRIGLYSYHETMSPSAAEPKDT